MTSTSSSSGCSLNTPHIIRRGCDSQGPKTLGLPKEFGIVRRTSFGGDLFTVDCVTASSYRLPMPDALAFYASPGPMSALPDHPALRDRPSDLESMRRI